MAMALSELVDAWLHYQRERDAASFWAVDHVMVATASRANPEHAWAIVRALFDAAPDDLLGAVAAGPLENVLTYHTSVVIDDVETMARRDPRFRRVLGKVWLTTGAIPRGLETRLVRASNGVLRPFPNPRGQRRRG